MSTTLLNALSPGALTALCDHPGPAVSVYLSLTHEPGDQGLEADVRWRSLRDELTRQAADPADIAAIEPAVMRSLARAGGPGRVLAAFATDGRELAHFELDRSDVPDEAVVGRWPRIEPLLRWLQHRAPLVVAEVNRSGGHLTCYGADGAAVLEESITGPDDDIRLSNPGGWARGRYQHRAEDSWAHNAAAVGHRLAAVSGQLGAEVIILIGDGRAVHQLTVSLPEHLVPMIVRAPEGSMHHAEGHLRVDPDVRESILAEALAARRRAHLRRLDDAVSGRRAVEGARDVRAALDRGAVRELLIVHGDAAGELVDALVAAAIAEDSEITVLEHDEVTLVGGVAAILRF